MVTYPISIRRDGYRGSDPRKREKAAARNSVAASLESYINGLLHAQTKPICDYRFWDIAEATGVSYEVVRDLGHSIDCSSNGFTAFRRELSLVEALNLAGEDVKGRQHRTGQTECPMEPLSLSRQSGPPPLNVTPRSLSAHPDPHPAEPLNRLPAKAIAQGLWRRRNAR
jgi:hypothetical protein